AVLALQPDKLRAHLGLGKAFRDGGRPAQALEQFQLAAQGNPKEAEPHRLMADLLLRQNDPEAAMPEALEAARLAPNEGEPRRLLLGSIYERLSRAEEALPALREATRLAPKDPEVFAALAGFYIRQKRFAEAGFATATACRLDPENEGFHRTFARLYRDAGRA